MLDPEEKLEITDVRVGHINCYVSYNDQMISFSVDNDSIYNITQQIGLGNIVDSITESQELLDLVHPTNIIDYLICNYSWDELKTQLDKAIEEGSKVISEEYRSKRTFKDYDEFWTKIRTNEIEQVRKKTRQRMGLDRNELL